ALLLLAHARVARRCQQPGSCPPIAVEICDRLSALAGRVEDVKSEGVHGAVLSAASMLLMHCARASELGGALFAGVREGAAEKSARASSAALQCVLAWSDSGAPRHEIHKAVAAAAALGGQLLQIPPGRSGTRSDLAAQLSTALPKLLDSVLNGGLEESVEVMEGWHLDGCLYAMSVTEALVAAGCPRASNSEVQDTWHDQRQAVVSELKRRRQALSERSVRFWLARVFEPGLLAWSDKLPALLVDELLGASEEGRGTAAEARRTA
ncbi:unnamed protein product, partial [Polarella glacialis]